MSDGIPRPVSLLVLVAAALAGCASVSSPSPGAVASLAPRSPASTPVPTLSDTPLPLPTEAAVATAPDQEIPGQSDTAWGRIWDELPVGFPTSGAGRAVQIDLDEVASGAFDLSATVDDVGPAMQAALEGAGFSTLSMSGPFEDGSVIIESVGPESTDCLVQTTIAPLGSGSRMTILYGAACPFPLE